MVAVVTNIASGESITVASGNISVREPSVIQLEVGPKDIAATIRQGDDLVIRLQNGEAIRVADFYASGPGEASSKLVLVDENGVVWDGNHTVGEADFSFTESAGGDQLVGGAEGGGDASILGLAALGALGAGGIALASGGGGGGDDNDDSDADADSDSMSFVARMPAMQSTYL